MIHTFYHSQMAQVQVLEFTSEVRMICINSLHFFLATLTLPLPKIGTTLACNIIRNITILLHLKKTEYDTFKN